MTTDRPAFKERLGIALARAVLWLTGNPQLSRIAEVLGSIRERRLAISVEPFAPPFHPNSCLSEPGWIVWDPSGALSCHSELRGPS